MDDRVQRELWLEASADEVWEAVTEASWMAIEAHLELRPGGEAWFRCEDGERTGWVEEAQAPAPGRPAGLLAFWWAAEGEPASRVEVTVRELEHGTRVRVVEARPLEILDLVGVPLARSDGRSYGPALVAA